MAHPDSLRHRRFRMTGSGPHAPRGTAGRGPNWDRGPGAGRAGAARRWTTWHRRRGPNRDHWPWTGRGGFASTHAHLGTAGRKTLWGPRAAGGPEELRDSELSHGCRRDAVTVCFQYLVPQVTVSDDSTIYSDSALLDSELGVETRLLPFELGTKSIKADGEETRQSSYNPNRV